MKKLSLYSTAIALLMLAYSATAGDVNGWKKRTVYQILTDRFWRSNGDTSLCDLHNYCGGDHDGMAKKLQYVKDLGFDAIWISLPLTILMAAITATGLATGTRLTPTSEMRPLSRDWLTQLTRWACGLW